MASPTPKTKPAVELLTFYQAIEQIIVGKTVTRLEWGDRRHYCLLKDGLLSLHKAGEADNVIHPWLVNDGDILGRDWIVVADKIG
jgi:hypothetical protein